MFSACSKKDLMLLRRLGDRAHYSAGDVLVKEGSRGHELFVVLDGEAQVSRGRRKLAILGPGSYFGELAFLDPAPRNATVTALTDLDALVISERELATLLADVPAISRRIMVGMARRLQEADARPLR